MNRIPDHWIKPNDGTQTPRRFIFLDTESRTETTAFGERQTWRCGVANYVYWTDRGELKQRYVEYTEPEQLWADIVAHTRKRARTVLYAHNLPYDMRIANLIVGLMTVGWHLDQIRLDSRGSWSRWTSDTKSLILCDTASIFPCEVRTLAPRVGLVKTGLPDSEDMSAWLAHCRRDVEIITKATCEYLTWIREGNAGNWQMTGSSQSWSHWRHCFYTDRVLVHHDQEATAAERRAMWTGRAENWRWGKDDKEPLYEWDWANAYPRVARDVDVPVRLVGYTTRVPTRSLSRLWSRYCVLAEVTVTTNTPLVPTAIGDGICWPVGEFTTTLWDPELRLLVEKGAHVVVHKAYLYDKASALREWATWVLNGIHSEEVARYRWLPLVLKHWSRSLIGRFSMRYQSWQKYGVLPDERVRIGTMVNTDTGCVTDTMQIGRDFYTLGEFQEAPNSCPQITGYVMSHQRAKLWNAIQIIGAQNVFYMDTDSIVVSAYGDKCIREQNQSGDFEGLRLKGRHRGYEIYGPRAVVFGDESHFAGLPRGAQRISDTEYLGEVWTGIEHSVRKGEFDNVTIAKRRFTIRWNDKRRERCPDGSTRPHRLPATSGDAGSAALPPTTERERADDLARQLHAGKLPATA